MTEELLALQAVDTTADQLTHRRSHLPELADATTARASRTEWERRRDEISGQLDVLTAEIDSAEHDTGLIDRHRDRLNAQLRTVIAPREAEALQHEIKTLSDRRSALDDRELSALEQQAELDDQRASHLGLEPAVSAALEAAESALATAIAEIDQQLAELVDQRAELRSGVPAQLLARYDRLRGGARCRGRASGRFPMRRMPSRPLRRRGRCDQGRRSDRVGRLPAVRPAPRALNAGGHPVLLWFAGTAIATIWFVFRDPRFDYRLLVVGSVAPPAVDVWFGGARVLHSVTFSVVLLAVVMIATIGRRPLRRTLLGLPLGTLLHLVYTGAWANTSAFWWPFTGGFDDARLPIAARGWWNLPLELAGLLILVWTVRATRLTDPMRRRDALHTGRLDFDAARARTRGL